MQPRYVNDEVEGTLPDVSMTFVRCEEQKNVHVFIPEAFDLDLVTTIAENFSRKVQQPVRVFHDEVLQKFRLCPIPEGSTVNTSSYGVFYFLCDKTEPRSEISGNDECETNRISRPRNSWILYRQFFAGEFARCYPGITASELSTLISTKWKSELPHEKKFWHDLAEQEKLNHRQRHPDYKYRIRKPQPKKRKAKQTGINVAFERE
uniref:Mat1-1-3 n=1 Tax=Trichoderma spinulosum TaxID=1491020 RepID=A0A223FZ62_TRISN|nr:mat1-1-3 [Trichoderma spinulosum]AST15026.1 mat1-1-3 [Trichoderma spinulosum]